MQCRVPVLIVVMRVQMRCRGIVVSIDARRFSKVHNTGIANCLTRNRAPAVRLTPVRRSAQRRFTGGMQRFMRMRIPMKQRGGRRPEAREGSEQKPRAAMQA